MRLKTWVFVFCEHPIQADVFNRQNPFLALMSSQTTARRPEARLLSGEIRFIFTVDIYNEGVDIPEVNTVLFLRPTESLTIFLQQLGRGLRLVPGKDCLTVLDFIGQANRNYSFESKFAALLDHTRKSVEGEIRAAFHRCQRDVSSSRAEGTGIHPGEHS
jgi:superfamily II DNA or RNA helicase